MTRLLLTVGCLAVALLAYALMRQGWNGRLRRQAELPAPPTPAAAATVLAGPSSGLLVGTTDADNWLDRVAVHHLSHRAAASLSVREDGVHVARSALPELLLPWHSLESAEVESALGGKVVSTGMLLLTWRLGARRLRTAFRADDRTDHDVLRDTINARLHLEASA